MKRGIFDHRDIGHRSAAHQGSLQQVMAEHLAIGQATGQNGMHGLNMQQALAGEGTLAEQVLIDFGGRRAVGVYPALPGEKPVIEREIPGHRQRRDHAGLQNAVTADHVAPAGIQNRAIVRMRRHANQFTQASGRQLRIAVQGHHILRVGVDN